MKNPYFVIVILNWNQGAQTVDCLRSVEKLQYSPFDVIVVDNGSSDDSLERLRRIEGITLVEAGENLGVGGGRNLGIEKALERGADWVFFLDNDTEIHSEALSPLAEAAQNHPEAGILGPKFYFLEDRSRLWCVGGSVNLFTGNIQLRGHGEPDQGQYDQEVETAHIPGAGLIVRRDVFDRVGVFDPNFTVYFSEDTDLCLRASKAGFKVRTVPRSVIWHQASGTSGGRNYHFLKGRNILYFMRKHASPHHWVVFAPSLIFGFFRVGLRELLKGNFKEFGALVAGALASLRLRRP